MDSSGTSGPGSLGPWTSVLGHGLGLAPKALIGPGSGSGSRVQALQDLWDPKLLGTVDGCWPQTLRPVRPLGHRGWVLGVWPMGPGQQMELNKRGADPSVCGPRGLQDQGSPPTHEGRGPVCLQAHGWTKPSMSSPPTQPLADFQEHGPRGPSCHYPWPALVWALSLQKLWALGPQHFGPWACSGSGPRCPWGSRSQGANEGIFVHLTSGTPSGGPVPQTHPPSPIRKP